MSGADNPQRVAVLGVRSAQYEFGGAERLVDGLCAGIEALGMQAERIEATIDETDIVEVMRAYIHFYDLDLSGFDYVISTKAPSFAVRHRNHVCYLPHTMRQFYDMFDEHFIDPSNHMQRSTIHQLDRAALRRPSLKRLVTVGEEVRNRLQNYIGVDSEVMHHPTTLKNLRCGDFRHLLLPGRLHRWKRVDLVIDAVRRMKSPVNLVICGTGEEEPRLRSMANGFPNIRFAGHVSEQTLCDLYADALAVLYCPVREDYGLVTVEAFQSAKPVVTCTDSGEPANLVTDGRTGYIRPPDADALAERLDWLVQHSDSARVMGAEARESAARTSWESVCRYLLSPVLSSTSPRVAA